MTDISGYHVYKDTMIMQHKDVAIPFKQLFTETKPFRILEIGTSSGGLTLLLRDILDELNLHNTKIVSYDVLETHRYALENAITNGANIEFFLKDIFNHTYSNLIEVDEIKKFIQDDGVTIVLCDGGNKKTEFNILSSLLKVGDIIMAHDYAPTQEYFETHIKNKIWNWCEIQDVDVIQSIEIYNLHSFMQEEFLNVVWLCKIKQ